MRVPVPLASFVLLSLGASVWAGAPGEGAGSLSAKRPREQTSCELPAKKTPPSEQPSLEWAAELRASTLAWFSSESPEHASLETDDQKSELVDRMRREFLKAHARSTSESLIIAPPPPDLRQELLAIHDALIERLKRNVPSWFFYLDTWDIDTAWRMLKGECALDMDKLENEFGWLRCKVFESMKVDAKGRILGMLTDLLLRFMLKPIKEFALQEIASLPEIIDKLEGELDKLVNWEALEISKLFSAILLPLVGFMPANHKHNAPTVDAACLLTVKYLRRQLPPDLQAMADEALDLSVPSCIQFKYVSAEEHFSAIAVNELTLIGLIRARSHFDNDLAKVFDNALRNLRFRVEVMELTRHAPQFPKRIAINSFDCPDLDEMSYFLGTLRRLLANDKDARFQDTQCYYDLFTQLCGRFTQACREYAHIPGLSEKKVLKQMRGYIPDFVPPEPEPRVLINGAHNVEGGKR